MTDDRSPDDWTTDDRSPDDRATDDRTAEYPVPQLLSGTLTIDDIDAFLGEIRTIRDETDTVIQVVDARYVVSRRQLDRAVARAARAIDRGAAVASDQAVEVLLYAAGRRQIDEALEMGVDTGETDAIAIVYSPTGQPHTDGSQQMDTPSQQMDTPSQQTDTSHQAETPPTGVTTALRRLETRFETARIHPPGTQDAIETWLDSVRDPDRIRTFHDVTDTELEATLGTLTGVIEERVALLDVEK